MITLKDKEFYNEKSGKLIAIIDNDGNVVFEKGMFGMTAKLKDFCELNSVACNFRENSRNAVDTALAEEIDDKNNDDNKSPDENPSDNNVDTQNINTQEQGNNNCQGFDIDSLSEDSLPKFDKVFGVETPEFKQFVKINKLSAAQQIKLIRRCEKRK